jgi:hypothetical protein
MRQAHPVAHRGRLRDAAADIADGQATDQHGVAFANTRKA